MAQTAATIEGRLVLVAEIMMRQAYLRSGTAPELVDQFRLAKLKTASCAGSQVYRELLQDAAAILGALDRLDAAS